MKNYLLCLFTTLSFVLFAQEPNQTVSPLSLIGQNTPDFSGTAISGTTWNIRKLEGKVVVINFWFIGCLPCMKEIPYLNQIDSTFKNERFILLSIAPHVEQDVLSFNSDSLNTYSGIRKYLAKQKIKYEIIPACTSRTKTRVEGVNSSVGPDCKAISEDFNIDGYPTTFVIDKKGVIRFVHVGFSVEMENPTIDIVPNSMITDEIRILLQE
jgi:thiol-disulfide isomerase/thioredoxin